MSRHPFHKRLMKEYKGLSTNSLSGITLLSSNDDLTEYIFQVSLRNHAIYKELDLYCLRVSLTKDYPVDSPCVQFVHYMVMDGAAEKHSSIPYHPHIYSNGHICLNVLGDDWTPACSIESILVSIQSMLDTNSSAARPVDNDSYVKHAPLNPKLTLFVYHDDNV